MPRLRVYVLSYLRSRDGNGLNVRVALHAVPGEPCQRDYSAPSKLANRTWKSAEALKPMLWSPPVRESKCIRAPRPCDSDPNECVKTAPELCLLQKLNSSHKRRGVSAEGELLHQLYSGSMDSFQAPSWNGWLPMSPSTQEAISVVCKLVPFDARGLRVSDHAGVYPGSGDPNREHRVLTDYD